MASKAALALFVTLFLALVIGNNARTLAAAPCTQSLGGFLSPCIMCSHVLAHYALFPSSSSSLST